MTQQLEVRCKICSDFPTNKPHQPWWSASDQWLSHRSGKQPSCLVYRTLCESLGRPTTCRQICQTSENVQQTRRQTNSKY